MIVYLLRHGIAEDRASSGQDADRALTKEGIARLETVLKVAQAASMNPTLILSSPYVRAVQTAEVAKSVFQVEADIVRSNAFTPNSAPVAAWDELRQWTSEEQVLVATHEPLVSSLFSFLIGVNEYVHDFKKAGLAKLEMVRTGSRPAATVKWILTPSLAAAIRKG